MIESSRIWRRKNFWDRFLNDEKQEVNLDESNGKRLVSEKLNAGYSEYVMGRRRQQTSRFSNQAVTFKFLNEIAICCKYYNIFVSKRNGKDT